MENLKFLNIPDTCYLGNTIFKKLFYDNADLSTRDIKIFTDVINKITWVYTLKPDTININVYKDEIREYSEIEVIQVEVNEDNKLDRIAEIIMRTIPYPMLLVFRLDEKIQIHVAHQRINLVDSSKNTIDEFISTEWHDEDSEFLGKLDISNMRFTNYFTLYSDIVDVISIHNVSDLIKTAEEFTGEEARKLSAKIDEIDIQVTSLRSKMKKENQFNRKMEFNIEIKKLEQEKNRLLGGDNK